uniref:Uncharacterized protein n=1 Tax=Ditylenchus dipsaci TaxID=166011 RepID=A0A915D8J1_9BILA
MLSSIERRSARCLSLEIPEFAFMGLANFAFKRSLLRCKGKGTEDAIEEFLISYCTTPSAVSPDGKSLAEAFLGRKPMTKLNITFQSLSIYGYVGSSDWTIIRGGEPSPPTSPFYEVVFEKHPLRFGRRADHSGLAYLVRYTEGSSNTVYEIFGQSYINSDGLICAKFVNVDNSVFSECDGFRLLSNQQPNRKDFFLVRPEEVDEYYQSPTLEINIVQFLNQQAVVMYDPQEDSSFFGTLRQTKSTDPRLAGQKEAVGVNYKGITVTYSGKTLLSGNYIMLIAKRNYVDGQ